MRSRRSKRNGSAFSLFAFQDILTTTIGVVLLIMLLLVLEISKANAVTVIEVEHVNSNPLTTVQLQEQIELHIKILSILSENSPEEAVEWIQSQIEVEQNSTERLIQSLIANITTEKSNPKLDIIKSLHDDIEKISKEIEEIKSEIIASLLDSDSADELKDLKGKKKQLQYQLDGMLANDSLVYIKQDDPNHTPFLVEITSDSITIHGHGIIPGMTDMKITGGLSDKCQTAVSIISQLADEKMYPLLLVQPGGGAACERIRKELKTLHISCGLDLLYDNQTTVPGQLIPGTVQ